MLKRGEHTNFQVPSAENVLSVVSSTDERLPTNAREAERELSGEIVPLGVLEALNEMESLNQRLIVGRRTEREHVRQTEQLGPIRAIKAPQQGSIVIVVIGGHLRVAVP